MRIRALILNILLASLPLAAADFGFSVVIRAGDSNTVSGQWELGIGPTGSAMSDTASITPNFVSSTSARIFTLGYRNATNTAFLRLYNPTGSTFQEVTYQPAGGGVPAAGRRWDLPGGSFLVNALPGAAGTVTVDSLSLSGVLTVLQPLSASTLTVSHTGAGGTASLSSGTVFLNGGSNSGIAGDWSLTGRIRLSGAQRVTGSSDRMGFRLDAGATNTPEPSTYATIGLGLLLFRFLYRRPRSNR